MSVNKEKIINDLVAAVKKAWDSFEENDIQAVNKLLNSITLLDSQDQDRDFYDQERFYEEFKTATNTESDFYHDMEFEDFVIDWDLESDYIRNELIRNMVMFISK